jgi:mRNA interferase YafQ
MRSLVLSAKFQRAFRKFVQRNRDLQAEIETILVQMQEDVFLPSLGTHKLGGNLTVVAAFNFFTGKDFSHKSIAKL